MDIRVSHTLTLDRHQVQEVFDRRLAEIIGDYFIKDNTLYRSIDDGRGRPWDEKVVDLAPEIQSYLIDAIKLKVWTDTLCPNRTLGNEPHRFVNSVAPGERCTDCGKFNYKR